LEIEKRGKKEGDPSEIFCLSPWGEKKGIKAGEGKGGEGAEGIALS